MISRVVALILILVIVIGGGILIYRFLRTPRTTNAKVLTINNEGKFSLKEIKLANNEVLKVKNEDRKNHTVKRSSNDETLIEVDQNATSREVDLPDNSRQELYLASNSGEKTTVVIGTPPTQTTETETEEQAQNETNQNAQGGSTQGSQTQQTQPLPNTGPEEQLLYVVFIFLGFGLAKVSNRLLRR